MVTKGKAMPGKGNYFTCSVDKGDQIMQLGLWLDQGQEYGQLQLGLGLGLGLRPCTRLRVRGAVCGGG